MTDSEQGFIQSLLHTQRRHAQWVLTSVCPLLLEGAFDVGELLISILGTGVV